MHAPATWQDGSQVAGERQWAPDDDFIDLRARLGIRSASSGPLKDLFIDTAICLCGAVLAASLGYLIGSYRVGFATGIAGALVCPIVFIASFQGLRARRT